MSGQNTESNTDFSDSTIGEAMARMPVERRTERHENAESNSSFLRKGDPGPLENENNDTPVEVEKEKRYSDIAYNERNAPKAVSEPANNIPAPLTEGIKPEQFRAAQQLGQTVQDAPVKPDNLLNEMISRIEMMKTGNQSTMSIQLKPEFLGKVALEIAIDTEGLRVKINAADGGVRAMLNGQINTLIESLKNKGIEVVEVEVTYTGIDNGAFKESREDQTQPDRSRRPYNETEATDATVYYSALSFDTADYYIGSGISSVEYQA
jgi:flagellar hook-length control protein FliK